MILCKWCNAVRPNDASACACSNIMAISERAAASLHIPERQFFENVLVEMDTARIKYNAMPTTQTVQVFANGLSSLSGGEFYVRLVIIAALAARIYVESTPQEETRQQLDELENQLKGL